MSNVPPLVNRFTDEYLDLMLEWGTIADIPAMVAEMRRLKQALQKAEDELRKLREDANV